MFQKKKITTTVLTYIYVLREGSLQRIGALLWHRAKESGVVDPQWFLVREHVALLQVVKV
jgi:hypothetical protein